MLSWTGHTRAQTPSAAGKLVDGTVKRLPEWERFGSFNRSYYEEVLVVRVHEDILKRQKLPAEVIGERMWDDEIAHFEDYLTRQATTILKWAFGVRRPFSLRVFRKAFWGIVQR